MEYKKIKELGSGGNGTVYLIQSGKEKLIYKLERMDKYDKKKPLTSEYYRQIKFNEDIAIHHPDRFMVLRSHGIIYNCDYKHPRHEEFMENMDEKRKRRYVRKNSQPNCYYLIYFQIQKMCNTLDVRDKFDHKLNFLTLMVNMKIPKSIFPLNLINYRYLDKIYLDLLYHKKLQTMK